ncbi:hypothetical protein GOQ29_13705 [Clostridium sp. D2Q-14]|uniref:hypothetical protein n=1 Tax=Anaeromonas gelatinilytica TaxID=2683194 RepID=UPI00193B012E|nr:hypothetical protein [Anaeromonas gelatinilytica]MBS4536674.1 hypothetical protein [Anaeromonas gelatinilytica]
MVTSLIIGSKITLKFLFTKIFIAIVLLGYSIAMYVLLGLADTLKESPFIKTNIKRFNCLGYIFFIEAIVEATYSSIFRPNEGIAQIFGLNITINLVTLAIISLTFF